MATWLPSLVRTNDAWPASFGVKDRGAGVGDRTFNDIPESRDPVAAAILARHLVAEAADPFLGATRRRVAHDDTSSAFAEASAASAALADAGLTGEDVDLVVSYTMVPDRVTPPSASVVADSVGAKRALAFGVDAVCASVVPQLEIARAYVESGQARVVLLTQSHLMLRALPMLHPAAPGLGDGASALVIARGPGLALRSTFGVTHGEYARAVTWVRGRDEASDLPWWKSGGDYRAGSRAPAEAKLLMQETVSYGADTVRSAAGRAGIDPRRIDVLASVQPRGFVPGAIAEHLGLAQGAAVTTYDDVAHVGACGPVFNLLRARSLDRLLPGRCVALYGQGAGFTRAAAVLEVTVGAG